MKTKTTNIKYSIKILDNQCKIYINGILHISFKVSEFIGVYTYMEGGYNKEYYIQFNFKSTKLITQYNRIDKWKSVIALLEKENLFE